MKRPACTAGPLAVLLWSGCGGPPPTSDEALAGATYLTAASADGTVTLLDGAYDFPPGSEVEHVEILTTITGDFDGDEELDAAVVLVEAAGDARFLRLHAMLSDGRHIEDVAARLLGDRIEVTRVTLSDGIVTVEMRTRRPGETTQARPSVPVTGRYALTDRGFIPIDPPTVREPGARSLGPADPLSLTSHEWIIESIQMGDWSQRTDSLERRPSVRFAQELGDPSSGTGRLSGYAGCNQMFATYQTGEEGSLSVGTVAVTRRACPEAAAGLEGRVIGALGAARTWSIEDDGLTVEFDGGVLRLRAGSELGPPAAGRPDQASPAASIEWTANAAP